jgi:MFS transporter, ACS family, glucarate transporter
LKEVFETPEKTRAIYQSLPLYSAIAGMLLGGWLSDLAVQRYGPRWGRCMPVVASRILVALAYVGCLIFHNPFHITLLMCLIAFAVDMGISPLWAWAQDVSGRHVGAVVGWANMWGNIGAAIAPMVFVRIRQAYPLEPLLGWNLVFMVCAGVQIVGVFAALGLDTRKKIDDQ